MFTGYTYELHLLISPTFFLSAPFIVGRWMEGYYGEAIWNTFKRVSMFFICLLSMIQYSHDLPNSSGNPHLLDRQSSVFCLSAPPSKVVFLLAYSPVRFPQRNYELLIFFFSWKVKEVFVACREIVNLF